MNIDSVGSTSGKDFSDIAVGFERINSFELQRRVEMLVGPLHERRSIRDRRQLKREFRGRRHTD